jgi:hypothetical protein
LGLVVRLDAFFGEGNLSDIKKATSIDVAFCVWFMKLFLFEQLLCYCSLRRSYLKQVHS